VAGSNTNWTIVRPGFLNDEAAKNSYRVIEDLSGVTSGDIARKDVAHFIVSALETNSHREQRVLITN
jgi:putative NADH-flavin reductase